MKYQCISADSHLEIRPDRYAKRVPEKFRDRAPKVITLEDGSLAVLQEGQPLERFPKLSADVPTLDFSGWPIYTLASTPDALVRDFCRALEESKALIPWAKAEPLPMAQMVRDSAEGHLEVPLHAAAEAFWRELGYLS